MAEKLINITAPQYRCPAGDCPAVYRSEDGKTFFIIGKRVTPIGDNVTGPGEEAVEIPADLLLSSLGSADLIEAAKPILKNLNFDEAHQQDFYGERLEDNAPVLVPAGHLRALRSVLTRIQGGK